MPDKNSHGESHKNIDFELYPAKRINFILFSFIIITLSLILCWVVFFSPIPDIYRILIVIGLFVGGLIEAYYYKWQIDELIRKNKERQIGKPF